MGTQSLHTSTATVVVPTTLVPAYELVPGFTAQIPERNIYTETWPGTDPNAVNGWLGDSNSATRVEPLAGFGKNALMIRLAYSSFGQPAKASKTLTGLVVGRSYRVTMDYTFGGARENRDCFVTTPARNGAGFIPLNPDGSYRDIFSFTATSTTQIFTISVTGIPNDTTVTFMRGASILNFSVTALATSFYTPPVMQPPTTIPARTIALKVKATEVTLDDSWSPYAQATLTCFAPTVEILEALDPRLGLRVTITLVQRWGDESGDWNNFGYRAPVVRTFDLSLRERAVNKETGDLIVTATSDEGLLLDYALVATAPDTTPVTLQSSLRAIVNYALSKVGGALSAGDDTHVTVSQSPNLFINPSGRRGLAGYTSTGGALFQNAGSLTALESVTAGAAGSKRITFANLNIGTDLKPNTDYAVSISMFAEGQAVPMVMIPEGSGVASGGIIALPYSASGFQRGSAVLRTSAAGGIAFSVYANGALTAATHYIEFRDAQIEEGKIATPYFDGAQAADAKYVYAWQGAADASPSKRTLVTPRSAQLLDWTPGTSAWDFLESIVQATGYRLWCDENRVWKLAKAWNTQTQINVSPATGLTSAVDRITKNESWYDSVVIEYRWTDAAGVQQVAYDTAGVGGKSTLTLKYENTPFPGAGAAASVLRRATGKGRIITPTATNNYLATPGMVLQISLPDSPVQTGMLSNVTFNQPSDLMQVGSRALTDTPANAWINALGTWAAATSTWAAAIGTN